MVIKLAINPLVGRRIYIMKDHNGITITTSEDTDCQMCDWREDNIVIYFISHSIL